MLSHNMAELQTGRYTIPRPGEALMNNARRGRWVDADPKLNSIVTEDAPGNRDDRQGADGEEAQHGAQADQISAESDEGRSEEHAGIAQRRHHRDADARRDPGGLARRAEQDRHHVGE